MKVKKYQIYKSEFDKGLTVTQIADKYGVTKQCVSYAVIRAKTKPVVKVPHCVYPNLYKWMESHGYSMTDLCNLTGCQPTRFYNIFRGKNHPNKSAIDALVKVTGIPYEELFYRPEES